MSSFRYFFTCRAFYSVLMLIITAGNTHAQDLSALTLEQALKSALENQPSERAFRIENQISTAQVDKARLQKNLKLNGNVDMQANPFLPASVVPVGQFNVQNPTDETRAIRFGTWWQATAGVTATKSLYDAGLNAQIREQDFQSDITENNHALNRQNIALELTKAWYALLLSTEEVGFLKENYRKTDELLKDALNRRNGGAATESAVINARMQLNSARIQLEQAESNRKRNAETLLYRMGISPEKAGETVAKSTLTEAISPLEKMTPPSFDAASAATNRPEIQQFLLDNRLQQLRLETEKARLKPTLSAFAFFGMNNLTNDAPLFAENSWFSNGNIGLQMKIPVSGYWEQQKQNLPISLKQQYNSARQEEYLNQTRWEYEQARTAFITARQQLTLRKDDIDLARQQLELASNTLKGGAGIPSDVLNAQTTLREKEFNWLQTAGDLLLAELALRKASGKLF
ncbi:MAG: TolC family protein [Bacteroidota bacterium]